MSEFSEAILPELAIDAPPISSQEQLFDLIAERLLQSGIAQDYQSVKTGFKKREEVCSTGVGHGVALPHSATTAVNRIVVVIVRLKSGLEWHAHDNKPVNLVVSLISPPALYSTYLQLLAALARALHLPAVREAVFTAPTAADGARYLAHFIEGEFKGTIEPVC